MIEFFFSDLFPVHVGTAFALQITQNITPSFELDLGVLAVDGGKRQVDIIKFGSTDGR